jgi:hypothetical protein
LNENIVEVPNIPLDEALTANCGGVPCTPTDKEDSWTDEDEDIEETNEDATDEEVEDDDDEEEDDEDEDEESSGDESGGSDEDESSMFG